MDIFTVIILVDPISCKQWKIFNALVLALGSFSPLFSQDHVSTRIHNKSSLLQIDSQI